MYREIAGTDERVRAIPGVRDRRVRATKVRLYIEIGFRNWFFVAAERFLQVINLFCLPYIEIQGVWKHVMILLYINSKNPNWTCKSIIQNNYSRCNMMWKIGIFVIEIIILIDFVMHYSTISSHNMIDNNKSIKYSKFLRNKHAEFSKLFIVKKNFQQYTWGQCYVWPNLCPNCLYRSVICSRWR